MQAFNIQGYEVRLFGATVKKCFEVMDEMKHFLGGSNRVCLSELERILKCQSLDRTRFTWEILDNRGIRTC